MPLRGDGCARVAPQPRAEPGGVPQALHAVPVIGGKRRLAWILWVSVSYSPLGVTGLAALLSPAPQHLHRPRTRTGAVEDQQSPTGSSIDPGGRRRRGMLLDRRPHSARSCFVKSRILPHLIKRGVTVIGLETQHTPRERSPTPPTLIHGRRVRGVRCSRSRARTSSARAVNATAAAATQGSAIPARAVNATAAAATQGSAIPATAATAAATATTAAPSQADAARSRHRTPSPAFGHPPDDDDRSARRR